MAEYYERMGDEVFRAQFRLQEEAFRAAGIEIAVVPYEERDVHFTHVVGRILARTDLDDGAVVQRILALLPGSEILDNPIDGLAMISTGEMTVPAALDLIDEQLGEGNAGPDHILSITGVTYCPATEPEVPCPPVPCPPLVEAGGKGVRIAVPDTGLVQIPPAPEHPWLQGVDGDQDPFVVPGNPTVLQHYAGHGTFCAGTARTVAPGAEIRVTDHFPHAGANAESAIFAGLVRVLSSRPEPQIISLSAGGHSRRDLPLIAGTLFTERYLPGHPETLLVAAAGNNSSRRPFWPAAHEGVVGVGALAADQQHRAWFSNYGDWISVWALGEGLVNAFGEGLYTYNEPPKAGFQQTFSRMARWSGTSFSTPLVAGLIAARMVRKGETSHQAAAALLAAAAGQAVRDAGPALFPDQQL